MKSTTISMMWRSMLAVGALVVGLGATANAIVVGSLNAYAVTVIHFAIGAGALLLLTTGPFRGGAVAPRESRRKLGSLWSHTRKIAVFAAALAIAIAANAIFVRVSRQANTEADVAAQLRKWAIHLEESQRPDGGIRAHHDKDQAQVWTSSQALCGLLAARAEWQMPQGKVQNVFAYIQRAQINPLTLRDSAKGDLQRALPSDFSQTNLKSLPARFPTFAMAIEAIELAGGGQPLPVKTVKTIEKNETLFFERDKEISFEGWGYFEQWEWGATEIAAWVCLAEIAALSARPPEIWNSSEEKQRQQNIIKIIDIIRKRQIADTGAFSPISDTSASTFARTYSTTMALWAMAEASSPKLHLYENGELEQPIQRALAWLEVTANADNTGWKEDPSNPADQPMLGLTAQTLFVIRRIPSSIEIEADALQTFSRIEQKLLASSPKWIANDVQKNDAIHDADRYLQRADRVTDRVIEGSRILWYPWTVALMRTLKAATKLPQEERAQAADNYDQLAARISEYTKMVEGPPDPAYNYVPSEALVGFRWPVNEQ